VVRESACEAVSRHPWATPDRCRRDRGEGTNWSHFDTREPVPGLHGLNEQQVQQVITRAEEKTVPGARVTARVIREARAEVVPAGKSRYSPRWHQQPAKVVFLEALALIGRAIDRFERGSLGSLTDHERDMLGRRVGRLLDYMRP
jgi:hypothetical protein